ncbi:hypothetical protein D3C72_1673670 [compost metagenome]
MTDSLWPCQRLSQFRLAPPRPDGYVDLDAPAQLAGHANFARDGLREFIGAFGQRFGDAHKRVRSYFDRRLRPGTPRAARARYRNIDVSTRAGAQPRIHRFRIAVDEIDFLRSPRFKPRSSGVGMAMLHLMIPDGAR